MSNRDAFYASRARIPVASQVTALEIWLLACILLVFGALGEYAFILRQVIQLSRKLRRQRVGSAVASSHAILQVLFFFYQPLAARSGNGSSDPPDHPGSKPVQNQFKTSLKPV